MATQTVEFGAETGGTVPTVKLFAAGSDTVVATGSAAVEGTNRLGVWVTTFTDIPAAQYRLIATISGDKVADWWVTLTLATATFQVYDLANAIIGGGGLDAAGVRAAVGLAAANLDAQLSTIDDFLDTEILAIKAKTDNLPVDPADASDIATSFASIDAKIDIIDNFLDTEIAEIKVVTDKYATMIVVDGGVYQFTANALELAPSGSTEGSGAVSVPITINKDGLPVDGVEVWITTDIAGSNVVAGTLITNAFGLVTFTLDAGSYYCWKQKAGINFTNPESFTA